MTAPELLVSLRTRGFTVRRDGSELVVNGPAFRDHDASVALLRLHKADLLEALDLETDAVGNDAVRLAGDVLGARLLAVRQTPTLEERFPVEFCGGWPAVEMARCA